MKNAPSCSRGTGSWASQRPTCGTSFLLHKQVPTAQATRRIHLAPSAPTAVLPLLTLLCLFSHHFAAAGPGTEPCVSVIAPGSPGGTISRWNQTHVVAHSAVPSDAPLDTSQDVDLLEDVDLPADDTSEAFDASAATANSSNCDPQSPDEVPVISPSDLAAVLAVAASSVP